MLVETYEVQEVTEQPVEVNTECSGLVEELELKGQEKFYNPQEPESADPFCYRKMTAQEKIVIEAICPKKSKIESYSDGPIPLRVLQVAAHVKELRKMEVEDEKGFIMVYHPQNADDPDPYLIYRDGSEYSPRSFYLLARWGDELDNWNILKEKARKILTAKLEKKFAEIKADVESGVASVKQTVTLALETGEIREPSYYR